MTVTTRCTSVRFAVNLGERQIGTIERRMPSGMYAGGWEACAQWQYPWITEYGPIRTGRTYAAAVGWLKAEYERRLTERKGQKQPMVTLEAQESWS